MESIGDGQIKSTDVNKVLSNRAKMYGKYSKGVTCRAVFVIDANGVVTYKEICPEITEEPNYDAALSAAKGEAATSCCGGGCN